MIIFVHLQVVVLIDLWESVHRISDADGRKYIPDPEHIIHHPRNAVVSVFICSGFNPEAIKEVRDRFRHR